MTNEEAIKQLKKCKSFHNGSYGTAFDLAIKALEQIELNTSYNGVKTELEPCDDCISRQVVIKHICESKECYKDECKGRLYKRCYDLQWIYALPPVTPTRPKGKWIILDECANEGVYCSECHKKVFKLEFSPTMKWRNFKYCPNCGADMREVEE